MKIVVIGGSGLIGSRPVGRLRQGGHEVIAASPSTGVNTVTGDGLPEAMENAQAAGDVAETLAQISVRAPVNGTVELAGPEPYQLNDIVGRVLAAAQDERLVIADAEAKYFGVRLDERTLIPATDPWVAPTGLDAWLAHNKPRL